MSRHLKGREVTFSKEDCPVFLYFTSLPMGGGWVWVCLWGFFFSFLTFVSWNIQFFNRKLLISIMLAKYLGSVWALGSSSRQLPRNRSMCRLVCSSSILFSWGSFMLHRALKYQQTWKIEYLDSSPFSPNNWTRWKGTKWFGDLSAAIFVVIKQMCSFRRVKKRRQNMFVSCCFSCMFSRIAIQNLCGRWFRTHWPSKQKTLFLSVETDVDSPCLCYMYLHMPCPCLLQHFWYKDMPRFCSVLPALSLFAPVPWSLPDIYTSTG